MPDTAQDVMTDAAVKLNDPGQSVYTNVVLLPFAGMASRELESLLEMNDIPIIKQKSTAVTVLTGATSLGSYPVDFVEPLWLKERTNGSSDLYVDMDEREWEPDIAADASLKYWAFRNNIIYFPAASTDRQVFMTYHRMLNPLTVAGSNVEVTGSRNWLAQRTAQMVAKDVMNSPTKALEMQKDVDLAQDLLIRRLVKNKQGMGVRRRAYRGYGRRQIA